ncbi:MAG: hypothetical protein Pg6C_01270 [Treponemataceae bacterium]|nr:MAG: hypothetical protein Pg6C_01270 [Treponemataceae bacterium]
MEYFILNVKFGGESRVDEYIGKMKKAPLYYGTSTVGDWLKESKNSGISPRSWRIAHLFAKTFCQVNKDALIVSFGGKNVYVYKQAGELKEIVTPETNAEAKKYIHSVFVAC